MANSANLIQLYTDDNKTKKAYPIVNEHGIYDDNGNEVISNLKSDLSQYSNRVARFLNADYTLDDWVWQQGAFDRGTFVSRRTYISPNKKFFCQSGKSIVVTYEENVNYIWINFFSETEYISEKVVSGGYRVIATVPEGASYFTIGLQKNPEITPESALNITISYDNSNTTINDAINDLKYMKFYCYDVEMVANGMMNVSKDGFELGISLTANRVLLFSERNNYPLYVYNLSNTEFTIPNFHMLVFNLQTNDIEVISESNFNAYENYILLLYNYYGYAKGNWIKYINEKINPITEVTTEFCSRQGQFSDTHENTIEAIKVTKERGFNNIRVSVCFTSDNIGVCCHFNDLSQQGGVSKRDGGTVTSVNISSLTYSELNTTYSYFGSDFVKLEDAITLCKNINLKLNIELKTPMSETAISNYMNKILELGMNDYITWGSNINQLNAIAANYAPINVFVSAHLTSKNVVDNMANLTNTGFKRIDVYGTDEYKADLYSYARRNGIKIGVGSAYTVESMVEFSKHCDLVECANIINPMEKLYQNYTV